MSTQRIGTVTADVLNVRPTPSTEQEPIAQLKRGQVVAVVSEAADWDQIEHAGGTAYVSAKYLKVESNQQIFIPDLYSGHVQSPDWSALAADPRFFGAILKAIEGISYPPSQDWFVQQWEALWQAGGSRSGTTWFRGVYHYLIMNDDGAEQAEAYLATIERAGGWRAGDLPPVVDVERGKEGSVNYKASKQQVIDVTSAWAETVSRALGCKILLYGRGAMRDLGITDPMGCDYLWAPQYNYKLDSTDNIGWPAELVKLWQYTDGESNFTSYPASAPGIGAGDLSLFLGSLEELHALAASGPR